jgi:cobalamin synthase
MALVETVVISMIAAVMYAGSKYVQKHTGTGQEAFDYVKFGATVVVAMFIGFMSGYTGVIPSETGVMEQLALYAGLVAIVESWAKTFLNWVTGTNA